MAHGAILGQSIPDLNNNYLALDGSNAMTGILQANAGINVTYNTAINLQYSNSTVGYVTSNNSFRTNISGSNGVELKSGETTKMLISPTVISAENNRITNLANGTADTDAATVGQLNAAVASSGPQYDSPTGNRHFDFYGLFVILQSNISSSTPIDPGESNCFKAAYEYIYRSPNIGDEMLLVQGAGSAFRIVYTSSGWDMSSIDQARMGEVYFIAGRAV